MKDVSKAQFKTAIQAFLSAQLDKKTLTSKKQLLKAQENNDHEKAAQLQNKIEAEVYKFQKETWMKNAAEKFTQQLTFGTHISKGIHPDSKGNNIIFEGEQLPEGILGSQNINSNLLDANGNAAALPLAGFFAWPTNESGVLIRDLIKTSHHSIKGAFSDDPTLSDEYQELFTNALLSNIDTPKAHERNKQLLIPINAQDCSDDSYHCLIPLYPSVLTHTFFHSLNQLKFSDENKAARDNRFKKKAEQKPYVTLSDIAVTQLGGTKPQNISQLMSQQSGRNYLLPSLPPTFERNKTLNINKHTNSIFEKQLSYQIRKPLDALFNLVQTNYNNVKIRDTRKSVLDSILFQLMAVADNIQRNKQAGWTIDFSLNHHEKLWLDPHRGELEEQHSFAEDRENLEWREVIATRFANWLNASLKEKIKHLKYDFGDPEHAEWKKEINEMIAESQRFGKEVFS